MNLIIFQEMASIHVKDFELVFGKSNNSSQMGLTEDVAQPFLVHREGSVAFLKLYLMPYKQFENLICCTTGCLPFQFPDDNFSKGIVNLMSLITNFRLNLQFKLCFK